MLEQQNYLGARSLVLYHLRHMYFLVAQVLLFADQFFNSTYIASNFYGMCIRYNLNSKTYPKSNCICEHACKTRYKVE